LVGVVSEIDLDEAMLGSLYELQASGQKSKKSSDKKPWITLAYSNLSIFLMKKGPN
jgi:hypothetical protein